MNDYTITAYSTEVGLKSWTKVQLKEAIQQARPKTYDYRGWSKEDYLGVAVEIRDELKKQADTAEQVRKTLRAAQLSIDVNNPSYTFAVNALVQGIENCITRYCEEKLEAFKKVQESHSIGDAIRMHGEEVFFAEELEESLKSMIRWVLRNDGTLGKQEPDSQMTIEEFKANLLKINEHCQDCLMRHYIGRSTNPFEAIRDGQKLKALQLMVKISKRACEAFDHDLVQSNTDSNYSHGARLHFCL